MVAAARLNGYRFVAGSLALLFAMQLSGCTDDGIDPDPSPAPPPSLSPTLLVKLHGGGVTPRCSDEDMIVNNADTLRMIVQNRVAKARHVFFGDVRDVPVDSIEEENERHDCQPLIARSGPAVYDSMLTVWAFRALGNGTFPQRTAVAGLYYEGSSAYTPLAIQPRANCVSLQTVSGVIHAYIQPLPAGKCGDSANLAAAVERGVRVVANTHFTSNQRVARLIETSADYYVGLQCGFSWCVIGGAPGSPEPSGGFGLPSGGGDQQHLAYKVGTQIKPSDLVGTIVPTRALFDNQNATDYDLSAVVIASITFTDTGPTAVAARAQYATKFGMTSLPNSLDVKMRRTASGYLLTFGGGPEKTVAYAALPNHLLRGMMRWRWLASDETTWTQCPTGCCTPF